MAVVSVYRHYVIHHIFMSSPHQHASQGVDSLSKHIRDPTHPRRITHVPTSLNPPTREPHRLDQADIMRDGSRKDEDVEDLVTGPEQIKPVRKPTFWEASHVQHGADNVQRRHDGHPVQGHAVLLDGQAVQAYTVGYEDQAREPEGGVEHDAQISALRAVEGRVDGHCYCADGESGVLRGIGQRGL